MSLSVLADAEENMQAPRCVCSSTGTNTGTENGLTYGQDVSEPVELVMYYIGDKRK